MIDTKYTYNGKIFIKLCNNKLSILQEISKINVAILYSVAADTLKKERLELAVSQSKVYASVIIIKVEIINLLNEIEQIFELSIENCGFLLETFGGRHSECDKTFNIFGGYHVRSNGRLVESMFTNDTGTVFTILTDPRASVYGTYMWMYSLWLGEGRPVEHCLYIGDYVVTEQETFSDLKVTGTLKAGVAERCYMIPITEDSDPVVVPWQRDSQHMVMFLAKTLRADCNAMILLGPDRELIYKGTSLDEFKYRSSDQRGALTLIYDVYGSKVKCRSLTSSYMVEVMIFEDRTVKRVKERLCFKLETSVRRLIICFKDTLLSDVEGVSVDEELTFFVGHSPENITRQKRVGSGGYGTVFKCTDGTTGEEMALKTYNQSMNIDLRCSIIREVHAMIRVPPHENIVRYMRVYIDNDEVSIGMEYMPQGSLQEYIDGGIPLSENIIRDLTRDIVKGLVHLKDNRIFHRDIKPCNVLLGHNNAAKLCDFGLSKDLSDCSTNGLYRDRTHTKQRGTCRWMAPEIILGEKYSFKADIWSVGATVVQMITGKVPFHELKRDAVIFAIGTQKTIPYNTGRNLSDNIKQFVDACLKPSAKDRPTSNELLSFPFLLQQ